MQYTILGERTGLKVSVLGFGAMRLPMAGDKVDRNKAVPMIHRAFEAGVNYIDTAVGYCNADSQSAVGDALKGWRDRVIVSTKNHSYQKTDHDAFQKNLEDSLRRLQVDYIDIYNLHGLNWDSFQNQVDGPGGSYRWIAAAKEQGLIRHICFSFHDGPEALVKIAATGLFDVVTCQYNILDQSNAPAFARIRKMGMGIVVMGPVGGGRLGAASDALRRLVPGARSVPEVAMRFVLANPKVNVALSGMSTMEQVEENLLVCSRKQPLTPARKRRVEAVLNQYSKLAKLYCTGCKYCMPCPSGVDIPGNFDNFNKLRVYDLKDLARNGYARSGGPARLCIACGRCMKKCPQHIDIIDQLRETVRALDQNFGKLAVTIVPHLVRKCIVKGSNVVTDMDARVECVNWSDESVAPVFSFHPGAGVVVQTCGTNARMGSFARFSMPIRILAELKEDTPIETGLCVGAKGVKVLIASTNLSIVPTRGVGQVGLSSALSLPVAEADPKCREDRRTARKHSMSFAASYDRKALFLRMKATDDLRAVHAVNLPVWRADRVVVELDLTGLAGGRDGAAPKPRSVFEIPLGAGSGSNGVVHIPGQGRTDKITARVSSARGVMTIDITCPWRSIYCVPGKKGRVLGLKLSHISYAGSGRMHCRRHWRTDGGWLVMV